MEPTKTETAMPEVIASGSVVALAMPVSNPVAMVKPGMKPRMPRISASSKTMPRMKRWL